MLCACGKNSNNQTYIAPDTAIKNDISVYKNEISKSSGNERKDTTKTNSYSTLNNDKFGWGMKRNSEHKTPEIPKAITDTVAKYNGIFVDDTTKKVIYLTFDEGYENGYTSSILDTLKSNDVKAAFFVTGPYVNEHADLVTRMINEGHIVGNHTISHQSLPSLTTEKLEQDIVGLDKIVYEKWKLNMTFIRPPMGEYSERVLAQLKELGHRAVFWSFAYDDYDIKNQKGTDYAYKMIMDNLHNGEVMLLHAVSKDNTEVLDKILKDIKAQGYEFKSLSEL